MVTSQLFLACSSGDAMLLGNQAAQTCRCGITGCPCAEFRPRDDHPNICKGRVLLAMEHLPHYRQAIDDIYRTRAFRIMEESKACPQPCSQLQARAALKSVRYGTLEVAIASAMEISLHIKKTVKVTRYMKAYGIFDLVVEIGSSLGLWIGLSALGLLQLLIDTMTNAKTKLFN